MNQSYFSKLQSLFVDDQSSSLLSSRLLSVVLSNKIILFLLRGSDSLLGLGEFANRSCHMLSSLTNKEGQWTKGNTSLCTCIKFLLFFFSTFLSTLWLHLIMFALWTQILTLQHFSQPILLVDKRFACWFECATCSCRSYS